MRPPRKSVGRWMNDAEALKCMRCGKAFTLFHRRHHCRCCGRIFDAACTTGRKVLPELHSTKQQRVCDSCLNPPPPPSPSRSRHTPSAAASSAPSSLPRNETNVPELQPPPPAPQREPERVSGSAADRSAASPPLYPVDDSAAPQRAEPDSPPPHSPLRTPRRDIGADSGNPDALRRNDEQVPLAPLHAEEDEPERDPGAHVAAVEVDEDGGDGDGAGAPGCHGSDLEVPGAAAAAAPAAADDGEVEPGLPTPREAPAPAPNEATAEEAALHKTVDFVTSDDEDIDAAMRWSQSDDDASDDGAGGSAANSAAQLCTQRQREPIDDPIGTFDSLDGALPTDEEVLEEEERALVAKGFWMVKPGSESAAAAAKRKGPAMKSSDWKRRFVQIVNGEVRYGETAKKAKHAIALSTIVSCEQLPSSVLQSLCCPAPCADCGLAIVTSAGRLFRFAFEAAGARDVFECYVARRAGLRSEAPRRRRPDGSRRTPSPVDEGLTKANCADAAAANVANDEGTVAAHVLSMAAEERTTNGDEPAVGAEDKLEPSPSRRGYTCRRDSSDSDA